MSVRMVNTHEAKSRLSELIREAELGTEVIVARNGQPVARIVAWQPDRPERRPGAWAGRIHGVDETLESDSEIVALFEESTVEPLPS